MEHKWKKKFGQNFITDKNLLKKIVSEANINGKNVIEIGPGAGALTTFLASEAKSLIAYEIDTDLKMILDGIKSEYNNVEVIYGDFLKVNLEEALEGEYHVVANIPYNITSPILFKILENSNIKSATLMVQKEVSDRITASANTKEYNALTVIVNYYMNVKKILNVSRKLFRPVPKVDSAVFKIERKESSKDLIFTEKFIRIVKASFAQKRKTILNNLSNNLSVSKETIKEFLESINIDSNLRAENLSLNDYLLITERFVF